MLGNAKFSLTDKKGGRSKWSVVRKKKSSLTRLAAFDRAAKRVQEVEQCEHLIHLLYSENLPDREIAVEGLIRAGICALPYLTKVCALMEHDHWTQRLTGVEALGSIAASEPTRDRLSQALGRLRIINAEISASRQRYNRLYRKKAQRREERILIGFKLLGLGYPLPEGISVEEESDEEPEPEPVAALTPVAGLFGSPTSKSPSSNAFGLGAPKSASRGGRVAQASVRRGSPSASAAAAARTGEGHSSDESSSSSNKLPPLAKPSVDKFLEAKPKHKTEHEIAVEEFVAGQSRLAHTARRIEKHTAEDIFHICEGTLALSLERMVTRDTARELEGTVAAARAEALAHGAEVVALLQHPRSPAAVREASLRTLTVLDGVRHGVARPKEIEDGDPMKPAHDMVMGKGDAPVQIPLEVPAPNTEEEFNVDQPPPEAEVEAKIDFQMRDLVQEAKDAEAVAEAEAARAKRLAFLAAQQREASVAAAAAASEGGGAVSPLATNRHGSPSKLPSTGSVNANEPSSPSAYSASREMRSPTIAEGDEDNEEEEEEEVKETEKKAQVPTEASTSNDTTRVDKTDASGKDAVQEWSAEEEAQMEVFDTLAMVNTARAAEAMFDANTSGLSSAEIRKNGHTGKAKKRKPKRRLTIDSGRLTGVAHGEPALTAAQVQEVVKRCLVDSDWQVRLLALNALEDAMGPASLTDLSTGKPDGGASTGGHWRLPALQLRASGKEPRAEVRTAAVHALGRAIGVAASHQAPHLPDLATVLMAKASQAEESSNHHMLRAAAATFLGTVTRSLHDQWVKAAKNWDIADELRRRTSKVRRRGRQKKKPADAENSGAAASGASAASGGSNSLFLVDADELGPRPEEPHLAPYVIALGHGLRDERIEVREACITALGNLRGERAARVAAPLLTRGECPADALRHMASATARKLRSVRGLRAQRAKKKNSISLLGGGTSGGKTGAKSLWKVGASSVIAAARLKHAHGNSSAGSGGILDDDDNDDDDDEFDGGSLSHDEGSQEEGSQKGEEKEEEVEMVRLGEPLLVDTRAEVRAAGCAALGMLGGGFMPPPPPPDAQTGHVDVQPKWTFDKDVARNSLKKRVEAVLSSSSSSLSVEGTTTAASTTAAGKGGGSSNGVLSPGMNLTTQGPDELPNMTADGESMSARALDLACPDLAARLLDLARMDPSPEVNLAAREALWRLGHAPLFAPAILKQLATGELPDDRVQAADSIGTIGGTMNGDPSGDGNNTAAAPKNVSSSARAQAVEFARGLARALEDSDWPVRAAAASNLHKLGAEAAEPHLARVAKLLHDESAEAKMAALGCVGNGGALAARTPGMASEVASLLHDPDDDVRAAAASGLGHLINERSDALYQHQHPHGLPPIPPDTLRGLLASLITALKDDAEGVRNAASSTLLLNPMGASAQVLSVSAILTDVSQPPSVRLVAANLINALPGQMLLLHVPKLLPALRKASGDLDESVRNAASEAIRKLSPLRAQAVRAAQAAAAAVAAGQPPPPLGFGGGGAEELRLSLKAFEATAPMHDPKRPGRKLATHPVNLVQALTDDYRKGLITLEEKDQAYERLAANAKAYNAAARVVNVAARSSEGVLPPHQTGDLVHALVKGVEIAATDQKEVLQEVSSTTIDFRSGRASALGLRWDREDTKNRAKYGQHGGGCDEDPCEWGEDSEDEDLE